MDDSKIAIIGLGYVGLPLCLEFYKKYNTVGFDISQKRIEEIRQGFDRTKEVDRVSLERAMASSNFRVTSSQEGIKHSNIYIITVPTPIDKNKRPDLSCLLEASTLVGTVIKKGDIVIYESTVYPGATEEKCVPELEQCSGLLFNKDFFCGYSPERINPGDKKQSLSEIKKITSGSTPDIAQKIDLLYKSIIKAGTYLAPSIKVAEAAKVIENSQRDINVAFVNELAIIFNAMGIDTQSVLEAASTKWNFMPFKPGLVGGHCIGVDPYYLAHKAQEVGINPHIILSGRRINDNMGAYIASQVIKLMVIKKMKIDKAKVLVLGVTFKENCTDIRNSGVFVITKELSEFGCEVYISDPQADVQEVRQFYDMELLRHEAINYSDYQVIVLAVAHDEYKTMTFGHKGQIVYDVKGILNKYDERL